MIKVQVQQGWAGTVELGEELRSNLRASGANRGLQCFDALA